MLRIIVRVAACGALAFVMLFGVGASGAGAQSADECVFEGDLQSYLACLAGQGVDQNGGDDVGDDTVGGEVIAAEGSTLARTGSNVGSLVGVGGALVILGGATVYGVHQRRQYSES